MRLTITALILGLVVGGANAQTPTDTPLPQFTGEYQIVTGATGTVRIVPALGGKYAEWHIRFDDPEHEVRMFLGLVTPDGDYPVWRFEQEPAPFVAEKGVARFDGGELVAEFASTTPTTPRVLRERWKLTEATLEFSLEAGTQGESLRTVGGFVASRE